MKKYYECHITMRGEPETIEPLVNVEGWKFSAINGDPLFGDGVLCYATSHFNAKHDTADVVIAMGIIADKLSDQGVKLYFPREYIHHAARLSSLSAVAWISASVVPGRRTA